MRDGDWLEAVIEHARATYPEECCGAILESASGPLVARRLTNIQNRLHAENPRHHPRDARTAYYIDPADLLALECDAERLRLRAIYHSHNDTGANFSKTDQRQASPLGEPLYPGVRYLVVSVIQGRVDDTALYAWQPESGNYELVPFDSLEE